MLNAEDWDGLVAVGREQVREDAHIGNVNVDYVGREGVRDMHELVSRLVQQCYRLGIVLAIPLV